MGGRVDVRSRERACEGRGACGIDSIVVRRPGRRPFAEVPGAGNRPLRRAMATATELEELAGNIQRNIQYFDTARQGRAFCGCAAEGAEETSIERRDFRSPQIRRSEFVGLKRDLRARCDEMKRRLRIAHFRGPRWCAVRVKSMTVY